MPATLPPEALDLDPLERAELRRRREVRRRVLVLVAISSVAALGYVAWVVGSHLVASAWLKAHQFQVVWSVDPETRVRGGSTTVKYGARLNFFNASEHSSGQLKYLTWLHRVESLDLTLALEVTDDELACLDRLTDLEVLNLDRSRRHAWMLHDSRLTDATLARIRPLARLRELSLGGQAITDAGLANLAGLDRLESLELRHTPITDAGLSKLAGLARLKDLDLRGTPVTDAGLEALGALPGLKSVDLTGTRVTDRGILAFEAARPGVRVHSDPADPRPR